MSFFTTVIQTVLCWCIVFAILAIFGYNFGDHNIGSALNMVYIFSWALTPFLVSVTKDSFWVMVGTLVCIAFFFHAWMFDHNYIQNDNAMGIIAIMMLSGAGLRYNVLDKDDSGV